MDNGQAKDIKSRVEAYLEKNKSKLDQDFVKVLAPKLLRLSDAKMFEVECYPLKNPTKMFFISLFLGLLGVDRFMMGDIGMGFVKLFTLGGAGVLWIIDMIKLPKRIKRENVAALDLDILDKH